MASRARLWTSSIALSLLALSLLSSPSHAQLRPRQAAVQPEKEPQLRLTERVAGHWRRLAALPHAKVRPLVAASGHHTRRRAGRVTTNETDNSKQNGRHAWRAAAVDSLEGMGRKQRRNGTATPAVVCGDGIISGGEQCDDSNLLDGDGCDRTCKIPPQPANLKLQGRPARFHCVVYGANVAGRRVEVWAKLMRLNHVCHCLIA